MICLSRKRGSPAGMSGFTPLRIQREIPCRTSVTSYDNYISGQKKLSTNLQSRLLEVLMTSQGKGFICQSAWFVGSDDVTLSQTENRNVKLI